MTVLTAIKRQVDERIVYDNSGTIRQLPQWTVVDGHGRGNCTTFTATYEYFCLKQPELPKPSRMQGDIITKWGERVAHAWLEVGPYSLDCRFPGEVIRCTAGGYYLQNTDLPIYPS